MLNSPFSGKLILFFQLLRQWNLFVNFMCEKVPKSLDFGNWLIWIFVQLVSIYDFNFLPVSVFCSRFLLLGVSSIETKKWKLKTIHFKLYLDGNLGHIIRFPDFLRNGLCQIYQHRFEFRKFWTKFLELCLNFRKFVGSILLKIPKLSKFR